MKFIPMALVFCMVVGTVLFTGCVGNLPSSSGESGIERPASYLNTTPTTTTIPGLAKDLSDDPVTGIVSPAATGRAVANIARMDDSAGTASGNMSDDTGVLTGAGNASPETPTICIPCQQNRT
ncbi:MAG: hypothetical protein LUQ25_06955 [Methanoregulaceae archaeon]|nr:hypothetical protein [Methanoregulaceae archaeon]